MGPRGFSAATEQPDPPLPASSFSPPSPLPLTPFRLKRVLAPTTVKAQAVFPPWSPEAWEYLTQCLGPSWSERGGERWGGKEALWATHTDTHTHIIHTHTHHTHTHTHRVTLLRDCKDLKTPFILIKGNSKRLKGKKEAYPAVKNIRAAVGPLGWALHCRDLPHQGHTSQSRPVLLLQGDLGTVRRTTRRITQEHSHPPCELHKTTIYNHKVFQPQGWNDDIVVRMPTLCPSFYPRLHLAHSRCPRTNSDTHGSGWAALPTATATAKLTGHPATPRPPRKKQPKALQLRRA